MSYSYFLVCVDCGRSILLGKAVRVHYKDRKGESFGFSALGNDLKDGWRPNLGSSEEMQHFLMLHRGHELRVIPETIITSFDVVFPSDDDTIDPLFNRSAFFMETLEKVDAIVDAENIPEEVLERLKQSSPT